GICTSTCHCIDPAPPEVPLEEPEAKCLVDDPAHRSDRRVDRLLGGDEADALNGKQNGLRGVLLHIDQRRCLVLRNLPLSAQLFDMRKRGCQLRCLCLCIALNVLPRIGEDWLYGVENGIGKRGSIKSHRRFPLVREWLVVKRTFS